jgi:hypothetical protein
MDEDIRKTCKEIAETLHRIANRLESDNLTTYDLVTYAVNLDGLSYMFYQYAEKKYAFGR